MGKILLADDSALAQRMGKEILSAEGFEVSTVSNGQAAAKLLKQFAPDLVLADVFMPGRNGYELCQLVKSDPDLQHIPVVLIIGKMEPYDETEGRKARADAVITKPLESSSLIETVRRLLAAVQKPAPPPAPPEPASIEEPPVEEPGEEDIPSPEAERMWTSAKEQLEIPDELGSQPLSVFGDLLESSAEADAQATPSPETPEMEVEAAPSPEAFSIEPEAVPPVVAESAIAFEETPFEQDLTTTSDILERTSFPSDADSGLGFGSIQPQELEEPAPQKEFIPESPPAELPETGERVWTAEPVAATEEDKKLFEAPPPPPDGEKLTKTVEMEKVEVEEAETPPARLPGDQPEPAASAEVPMELLPVSNTLPDAPPAEEKSDPAERTNFIPEIPEVEAAVGEDTLLEPVPAASPPPEEAEQETTTAVDSAAIEKLVRESAEDMMPQITDRIVRSVDAATIKQIVRQSVEDILPQIVDRITRSVENILRREQK